MTTQRSVTIPVTLPTPTYRAVEQIATARKVNAHTLIEQLVLSALNSRNTPRPARRPSGRTVPDPINEVALLNRQGMTDPEIAEQLGMNTGWVTAHRVAMKLPTREVDH